MKKNKVHIVATKPPWRNRLARSAVNRKVGGSSPPGRQFILSDRHSHKFVTFRNILLWIILSTNNAYIYKMTSQYSSPDVSCCSIAYFSALLFSAAGVGGRRAWVESNPDRTGAIFKHICNLVEHLWNSAQEIFTYIKDFPIKFCDFVKLGKKWTKATQHCHFLGQVGVCGVNVQDWPIFFSTVHSLPREFRSVWI